jgi:hypothetical protein
MDNVRFSLIDRQPSVIAGQSIDLNYQDNLELVSPVISDTSTTAIYNFDKNVTETEFLSNLLSRSSHLFNFDVNVIDSFDIISNNTIAMTLIESLIGRIKPAHTAANIRFLE